MFVASQAVHELVASHYSAYWWSVLNHYQHHLIAGRLPPQLCHELLPVHPSDLSLAVSAEDGKQPGVAEEGSHSTDQDVDCERDLNLVVSIRCNLVSSLAS